ncbi:MAG: MotA/TolQ/ExbB proton channel family protein [Planctomycetota bacterium]
MFEGAARVFHDGGPIMYPLLLCSLVSLTVIIERFIFHLRRKARADRSGLMVVLELVRKGDTNEAMVRAKSSGNDLLNAVGQSLENHGSGGEQILEMHFAEENRCMSRFMMVLDTIITLAPMLGILGTVLGIIDSFDLLGTQGARDPMAVTGGIARALITTAAGLGIAILTLIPYNYYRSKIESQLNAIEEVATFLETYVYRRRNTQGS